MKPGTYTNGPASCRLSYNTSIPAHLRGQCLEISHVLTPEGERKKGYANALIAEICHNADVDSLCLLIMPQPFSDSPCLSKAELADWYARRFGFFSFQDSPALLMLRMPYMMQMTRPQGVEVH